VLCEFDGNTLKLHGNVPSYYLKQVAQSLVLAQLDNTVLFENHLEVANPPKSADDLFEQAHA
jgi:hypothetical protein